VSEMKPAHFAPLLFFLAPTVVVSALVWPAAAMQPHLVGGFALMLLGMVLAYVRGIQAVLNDAALSRRPRGRS
jgi:hypothetical protein